MTDLQAQLLRFLKEFDLFCRDNKIEYCLFWGTLLGCIREGGFIPWDDDVDVVMDRRNFEKFRSFARNGKLPSHFSFEDSLFLKGVRVPKVRDKTVSIKDCNGGNGIFIDIFPFDRFSLFDVWILRFAALGLQTRDYRRKISNRLLRLLYTPFSFLPYLGFILVRKIYSEKDLSQGDYVGKTPLINVEHFFAVEDFFPFVEKSFEDTSLPVPKGYDSILKIVYGDYMVSIDFNNKHY